MEYVIYGILGIFSLVIIKLLIIDPEIRLRALQKKAEEQKKITPVEKIKKNKSVSDFTGIDKMLNQPNNFLKEVLEKEKRILAGDDVGVDAAQAFYLIRNFHHSSLPLPVFFP